MFYPPINFMVRYIKYTISLILFYKEGQFLSVLSNFPLFVVEVIDILYKVSMIIALFYTTKALRVYIDKNSRKQ